MELIERLNDLAARFGIGRGIHLGDTIFGLKGRVAFEAPAALVLITAHRELEKLTLTAKQQRVKDQVAAIYGDLIHEAQFLEPACSDIEALLLSSQRRVTGEVRVRLAPGTLFVEGVSSPHSLRRASRAVYGEAAGEWTAADARGFSRLLALPSMLYARAGERDVMRTVLLDKIASVTSNCQLSREVRLADEIPPVEGGVLAVRILNSKNVYNQLELPSGRFSTLKEGDAIAGTLGHRKALFGYSGTLPGSVRTGDRLHILNLGGVLGLCDSVNPDLGGPFVCEVLGQVLHFPHLGERIGVPAHIGQGALPLEERLDAGSVPVVAIVGTCMNSGKTAAACALVQALAHRGLRVAAGKVTGVSLRRDVFAMEDVGACATLIFTDFGIVTTTPQTAAAGGAEHDRPAPGAPA